MPSKRPPEPAPADRPRSARLDDVDRRILSALTGNPRQAIARLAKRVGLSRPAVAQRVRRLERDRVITGWRVDLDSGALGLAYTVFVRVRPGPGQAMAVEQLARSSPAVVEAYRTTGEEGFLLKMQVGTVPEFEQLLARFQRLGQTAAFDVLSAVVPPRAPPLTDPLPEAAPP